MTLTATDRQKRLWQNTKLYTGPLKHPIDEEKAGDFLLGRRDNCHPESQRLNRYGNDHQV